MMKDKDLPPFVYGALKREELIRTGSVVLHEHYFDNLGGDGKAGGAVLDAIKQWFGGYDAWAAEFKRTAMSLAGGSGWTMLSYNLHTGELHNYWAWDHMHNAPTGSPLLVLDMYEHAYPHGLRRCRCEVRRGLHAERAVGGSEQAFRHRPTRRCRSPRLILETRTMAESTDPAPGPTYTLTQLVSTRSSSALGFGGPVALVGYMHRDLVEARKWISEADYKEGLTLAQLMPGPLAAQLAIYLGYVHYGDLGRHARRHRVRRCRRS